MPLHVRVGVSRAPMSVLRSEPNLQPCKGYVQGYMPLPTNLCACNSCCLGSMHSRPVGDTAAGRDVGSNCTPNIKMNECPKDRIDSYCWRNPRRATKTRQATQGAKGETRYGQRQTGGQHAYTSRRPTCATHVTRDDRSNRGRRGLGSKGTSAATTYYHTPHSH
jgi:hypothetical protein